MPICNKEVESVGHLFLGCDLIYYIFFVDGGKFQLLLFFLFKIGLTSLLLYVCLRFVRSFGGRFLHYVVVYLVFSIFFGFW